MFGCFVMKVPIIVRKRYYFKQYYNSSFNLYIFGMWKIISNTFLPKYRKTSSKTSSGIKNVPKLSITLVRDDVR